MKTKIFFMLIVGLLLCACSDEEQIFSCNKEVDEWVKDHLEEIQAMDRENWLKSSEETAIAVYRAFTPNQKRSFWNAKLNEVQQLPWSDGELKHIEKAREFINSHDELLSDIISIEERNDIIDEFCYRWMETGITEFGWTETIAKSILGSGRRVINTSGDLESLNNHFALSLLSETEEKDCHCNQNDDFCEAGECLSTDCKGSSWGCGWFLFQDCNGRCGLYGFGPFT